MSKLIQSVTIYPGEGPNAEVSADITDMLDFAADEHDPGWTASRAGCVRVVAGVGFEPTTFRL